MANSRFRTGCHEIVYTLVYPGVLASMLYDFYQLISGGETFRRSNAMALVALLYLLDYFHLFVDLKELTRYQLTYDFLDFSIAALFGLAFAFAKVDKLGHCQACVVAVLLLMLAYSLLEKAELSMSWRAYLKSRWIYCALVAAGIAQMTLGRWGFLEAYLAAVCVLYIVHIFLVWRGSRLPVMQPDPIQRALDSRAAGPLTEPSRTNEHSRRRGSSGSKRRQPH